MPAISIRVTEHRGGLPVLTFRDGESFEAWLEQQPAEAAGVWLKLPKKSASLQGPTKAEAIDAALCHGWIDGQLDKYDESYWLVRFTPRKARSKWSEVNKRRATALIAEGRMRESGTAQIEARPMVGGLRPTLLLAARKSPPTSRMRSRPTLGPRVSLQR